MQYRIASKISGDESHHARTYDEYYDCMRALYRYENVLRQDDVAATIWVQMKGMSEEIEWDDLEGTAVDIN